MLYHEFDILVHVRPEKTESDLVKSVVQVEMVADGVGVESCKNDVTKPSRDDLKLNEVSRDVDCFLNKQKAVDELDLVVAEWLPVNVVHFL